MESATIVTRAALKTHTPPGGVSSSAASWEQASSLLSRPRTPAHQPPFVERVVRGGDGAVLVGPASRPFGRRRLNPGVINEGPGLETHVRLPPRRRDPRRAGPSPSRRRWLCSVEGNCEDCWFESSHVHFIRPNTRSRLDWGFIHCRFWGWGFAVSIFPHFFLHTDDIMATVSVLVGGGLASLLTFVLSKNPECFSPNIIFSSFTGDSSGALFPGLGGAMNFLDQVSSVHPDL